MGIKRQPAMPTRADPRPKVSMRIWFTLTPMSSAASTSWAVALMDLPVSVLVRKNHSTPVMAIAIRNETDQAKERESSIGEPFQKSLRYHAFVAYETGMER